MWCDKERKKPHQKNAKTYMKAARSWISYDKNFFEFQFEKKQLWKTIRKLSTIIHQAMKANKLSIKWIVQV